MIASKMKGLYLIAILSMNCMHLVTQAVAAEKTITTSEKKDLLSQNKNFIDNQEIQAFAKAYATQNNQKYADVLSVLEKAKYKQSIIDAISRPAEFTMEWEQYSKIFLKEKRIKEGIAFWKKHKTVVEAVSKKYQVEPEIILAILGVETWYGTQMGGYRVLDALMTLGFNYPPRSQFFKKELEQYLTLTFDQKLDPQKLVGSYAGAMGYGQFIPSSYIAYAKSYDGKGPIDIWENPADAIASVANYLHVHKWRHGDLITVPVYGEVKEDLVTKGLKPDITVEKLRGAKVSVADSVSKDAKVTLMKLVGNEGDEFWVGFNNFYVITRYNRSTLYSMAVYQLSQLLKYQMNVVK